MDNAGLMRHIILVLIALIALVGLMPGGMSKDPAPFDNGEINEAGDESLLTTPSIAAFLNDSWAPTPFVAPLASAPLYAKKSFNNNTQNTIPQNGHLSIETGNRELDAARLPGHPGLEPGPYVMLAVSDDGCGMDESTRLRVFEPFFTTKGREKGTGLGLSTVYGIVRQSGGHIVVESEPDRGATFRIYLPHASVPPAPQDPPGVPTVVAPAPRPARRTILLVEDETPVRTLAAKVLETAGHRVLPASGSDEAIAIAQTHPGEIHLVLTDLILPGMSGTELARTLAALRPGARILFMSGYAEDNDVHHGLLDPGARFIGKPFTSEALARKVREMLADD